MCNFSRPSPKAAPAPPRPAHRRPARTASPSPSAPAAASAILPATQQDVVRQPLRSAASPLQSLPLPSDHPLCSSPKPPDDKVRRLRPLQPFSKTEQFVTNCGRLVFTNEFPSHGRKTGFLDKWILGVVSKGDAIFFLASKSPCYEPAAT